MAKKKLRKQAEKKFTEDGLPRDARDWTAEDWRALWMGMQFVIEAVSRNHKDESLNEEKSHA